jgi:serine/threonine protein kinase
VKITPNGTAKVLDFGLGKALEDDFSTTDISTSPTMSHAATQAGILLGTAAYMSPEQARRTDQPKELKVVLNWLEELKRRAPPGKK